MPFTIIVALSPQSAFVEWSVTGSRFEFNVDKCTYPLSVGDGWYLDSNDEEMILFIHRTEPAPEFKLVNPGQFDADYEKLKKDLAAYSDYAIEGLKKSVETITNLSALNPSAQMTIKHPSSAGEWKVPLDLVLIAKNLLETDTPRVFVVNGPHQSYLLSYDGIEKRVECHKVSVRGSVGSSIRLTAEVLAAAKLVSN